MQTLIQILKLNDPRPWTMEGRSGVSHSAECLLLSDDGTIEQVGVLRIRGDDLVKKAQVGTYRAAFSLRSNPASRQIEAVLTDLTPVNKSGAGFVDAKPAALSAKAA